MWRPAAARWCPGPGRVNEVAVARRVGVAAMRACAWSLPSEHMGAGLLMCMGAGLWFACARRPPMCALGGPCAH